LFFILCVSSQSLKSISYQQTDQGEIAALSLSGFNVWARSLVQAGMIFISAAGRNVRCPQNNDFSDWLNTLLFFYN
jgi:hypothetical protein